MWKRLLAATLLLAATALPAYGRERVSGWCEQGGNTVTVGGLTSTTTFQQSFVSCTVTIFDGGTMDLSSIFSDDSGTVKSNPFTASSTGFWFFLADDSRYDIRLSGGGIVTPFTIGDILLDDTKNDVTTIVSVASSATPTFDASLGTIFTNTLTANVTSSTISNPVTGQRIVIYLAQDGVGGFTFAWPANVQLRKSTYVVADDVSAVSTINLYYDGTNWRETSRDADEVGYVPTPVTTADNFGTAALRWDGFFQTNLVDTTTVGKWNGVRIVDGTKFTTVQAAVSDTSDTKPELVYVPDGQDEGGTIVEPTQITLLDLRANNPTFPSPFHHRFILKTGRDVSVLGGNAGVVNLRNRLTGTPAAQVVDNTFRIDASPDFDGAFGSEYSSFGNFTRIANLGQTPPLVWAQEIQLSKASGVADSQMIGLEIEMQKIPALGAANNINLRLSSDTNVIAGVTRAGDALSIGGDSGFTNGIHYLDTDGSTLFQVDQTGRISSGKAPGQQLDIQSAINDGIRLSDGTTTGIFFMSSESTNSLVVGTTSNHPLIFFTNNVNRGNISTAGDLTIRRFKTNGTALVAGDFALSAGWGTTASVGTITGNDQWLQATITSAGTGQGASPTATLTFKDGTWTSAPIAVCQRADRASQTTIEFTWTTTATTLVLTFEGTPVAAETFVIACHVGGV